MENEETTTEWTNIVAVIDRLGKPAGGYLIPPGAPKHLVDAMKREIDLEIIAEDLSKN